MKIALIFPNYVKKKIFHNTKKGTARGNFPIGAHSDQPYNLWPTGSN